MKKRLAALAAAMCAGLLLLGIPAGGARAETIMGTIPTEAVTEKADGEGNRQALVEGYIEKTLYAGTKTTATRSVQLAGNNLTGTNKMLYLALSDQIAQVAAGTLTSTVFTFPVEDVYEQVTFTKEELGVDALVANGSFTAEAIEAVSNVLRSFDQGEILHALMADCPYELYWYNKGPGGGCRIEYPSFGTNGYSVTLMGNVTFKMSVAQEYAAGSYETDPSVGQTVNTAAQNAQDIADQYKDLDDFARLTAYKNAICELASYNYDAAYNASTPYGNPWQLIWVFDGDPETNVVCEGYSKAFQYLNELSKRGLRVISPSGTMDGGNHMWNVVTMGDGKNYLVDVTNCDTGMVGYPDKLFLAGCVSGSAEEGYVIPADSSRIVYVYGEDVYSVDQLKIAGWRYLDGKPPAPTFVTAVGTVYEHQEAAFAYWNAGYEYDSFLAQITYQPADGEPETAQEAAELGQDGAWRFVPGDFGSGAFSIRFAGVRDEVASDWSASLACTALDFSTYTPSAYTFSSAVGFPGYQVAVQLEDETETVVLPNGDTVDCQDGTALVPLEETGEIPFALAIQWREKVSAFGAAVTVTVEALPTEDVLEIPEGTQVIEQEAFRNIGAERAILPDSVEQVGAYAFADNSALRLVELHQPALDETAFDNCPNLVLCTDDVAWGYQLGMPFLVK